PYFYDHDCPTCSPMNRPRRSSPAETSYGVISAARWSRATKSSGCTGIGIDCTRYISGSTSIPSNKQYGDGLMTKQETDQLYRRSNMRRGFPKMVLRRIAVLGVLAGALTVLSCSGGGGGGGENTATTPATGTTTPATAEVAANDVVAPVNTATIQTLE